MDRAVQPRGGEDDDLGRGGFPWPDLPHRAGRRGPHRTVTALDAVAVVLRERSRIGPRTTMLAGAALLPLGPLALAHDSEFVALLGYSVLSGTGAGLVYATCTSTVAKWFPERSAGKVSAVTGAFAYGSVPFAIAFVFAVPGASLTVALNVTAVIIGLTVAAGGLLFQDPPRDWWPPHIDPRTWAVSGPRAVRQYSTGDAMHTGCSR